jgi:hypothetical protein
VCGILSTDEAAACGGVEMGKLKWCCQDLGDSAGGLDAERNLGIVC